MNIESTSKPHVLITGGAGLIGTASKTYFEQRGWTVSTLDLKQCDLDGRPIDHIGDIVEFKLFQDILTDIDGILRGKYMHIDKFIKSTEKGFGFCDVIFGWDSNDELYDTKGIPEKQLFTGWHSGFPDVNTSIIPGSARDLPFVENIPLVLAELTDAEVCPRGLPVSYTYLTLPTTPHV